MGAIRIVLMGRECVIYRRVGEICKFIFGKVRLAKTDLPTTKFFENMICVICVICEITKFKCTLFVMLCTL